MKKSIAVLSISTLLALLPVACGGEKKLGEGCDVSGKTSGECESGGVCGKSVEALVCLKVCTVQTDCAADQDCNGVDGTTTKGCRSKSTTTTLPDGGKK